MVQKVLAIFFTVLLIVPTYVAFEVCLVTTAFALITVIMLPPCLAIDYFVASTLWTLFCGCLRIWNNESSISQSDWAASILGILFGSLGIWFVQPFGRGRWHPDTVCWIASVSLIVSSLLIPFTLLILSQLTEDSEYGIAEEEPE